MKVKVTKETQVTITMDYTAAVDLAVFLQSEQYRRKNYFKQTSIMQCWPCLGICEDLLKGLKAVGFRPIEGHVYEFELGSEEESR